MECSIVVQLHPQPEIWPIRWSDGGKIEPPVFVLRRWRKKKIRGRLHQRVRGTNRFRFYIYILMYLEYNTVVVVLCCVSFWFWREIVFCVCKYILIV